MKLTDAIYQLLQEQPVYVYRFDKNCYNTGNKLGYIKIFFDYALMDLSLNKELLTYLQKRICT